MNGQWKPGEAQSTIGVLKLLCPAEVDHAHQKSIAPTNSLDAIPDATARTIAGHLTNNKPRHDVAPRTRAQATERLRSHPP